MPIKKMKKKKQKQKQNKAKLPVLHKIRFPVHSHLEYMLQKFVKIIVVKTAKQYYKHFQISYHYRTILTFSESYWQTTIANTFPKFISNNTDIFKEFFSN